MIKSKFLNKEELKEFYKLLKDSQVGYIQLSDCRIKNIYLSPVQLPDFDNAVSSSNFIYEASFFNENTKVSTLIRQIDDKWLVNTVDFNKKGDNTEIVEEYFITKTKDTPKVKMAHIWQEKIDEECDMPVLKHVYSAFVGFDTHPDSSSHTSREGNLNGENNNNNGGKK